MSRRTLLMAGLLVGLLQPGGLWAENIDRTFPLEAGGRISLNFDDLDGDIRIEGWDQNSVHVEGATRGRDWRDDEPLDFEATSRGLRISPRGRYHHDDRVRIELRLRVPRDVDLRVDTSTHLEIRNVAGRLDLSVANANLDLMDVKGEGQISSANGRMTLSGCQLDAGISNVNGRLRIEESDIKGDVSVVNSSMEVSHAPDGIELSSTNGDIELGRAARFVQVSTTNGNIVVDELDGWIEAETINGSVRVRLVGSPEGRRSIDIETLNGNVELEIPENYSLDFDVRVESRGDHDRYEIDSDFALDIEGEDDRGGEQRLRARGTLNEGENRVRIRAINGDVILKRLASAR